MKIHLKTPDEIAIMREAGRIVALAHQAMKDALNPGITTRALDRIAETVIRDHGATPLFLNHTKPNAPKFPATITASINHEIIHGIPSDRRVIVEGDVVSLDTGCLYQGFVGDGAWTYAIGEVPASVQRLLAVAEEALYAGIRASVLPHDVRTVARSIQAVIQPTGYGVVREYTGHGIGRTMWEVPHYP